MTEKLIPVAYIQKPHGVRGLVKLRALVEDESLISDPAGCFSDRTGDKPVHVKLKSHGPDYILAEIDAIPDRTEAEKWPGTTLFIPRSRLPASSPDDGVYLTDLIGMIATDTNGKQVGEVIEVANFGASDLLEIKPEGGKSFYVPFTDDFIIEADPENDALVIDNYQEFLG